VAWITLDRRVNTRSTVCSFAVTDLVAPTAVYVGFVKGRRQSRLKETKMKISTRSMLMAAAVLAAASVFAPAAWAGCGVKATALKKHASWTSDGRDGAMLIPVANMGQPIVGMWYVALGTGTPPSFDWGYQVWHDDGTEIMNSGGHSPASENFCMGVWVRAGQTYRLNHFALGYNPATGVLAARINIKEEVVVDASGNNFSGHFTATASDPNGLNTVAIGAGPVVGHRITVN
jgi:hypothetical protein